MSARRFTFTLNNPTEDEILSYSNHLASDLVKYGVIGNEVGANGTPHLQGFVIYENSHRFNAIRLHLPRAHIESARGTSQQARNYCTKDGIFVEYGTFPGNAGERNDLRAIIEWAETFQAENGRPVDSPQLAREQPIAYVRYPRLCRALFHRQPPVVLQVGERRPWQQRLELELIGDADDRSVLFYMDDAGRQGKTWFCRYMLTAYPDDVQLLTPGRVVDMAYAVDINKRIFIMNVAREQMIHLQYTILEQLKDRVIFSSKYHSVTKLLVNNVHVVVFCNEHPDVTKMSDDRFLIRGFD